MAKKYTADNFIINEGLSSQFLKADGSVDSTVYLPLTGGTMSGSLASTSALPFLSKFTGRKSWTFHHPDSNNFIIAPSVSVNGTDWDWSNQIIFNGDSGLITASNGTLIGGSLTGGTLAFASSGNTLAGSNFFYDNSLDGIVSLSNPSSTIKRFTLGNAGWLSGIQSNNGDLEFLYNGINVGAKLSGGNFLIGTTVNNGTDKLQVNGTISSGNTTLGTSQPTDNNQLTRKDYVDTALALKLNAANYNDRYKGKYTSLGALETAHPTSNAGDYAQVDAGSGSDVVNYNWDAEEGWVEGGSGSAATNTDALPEGSTNLYFTTARVLATVLTGISFVTGGAIVSTDSILVAFGKLQKQINDLLTAVGLKQDALVSGTNIKTINGSSILGSGNLTVGSSETATSIGALIGSAADATPNDSDYIATSLTGGGILKKITWTNVKAFLKTYFDTQYKKVELSYACSDESSNLTVGTLIKFRMPFAMTLTSVRASVNTAPTVSSIIVDVKEAGVSIFSTLLSIDATEKTSTTAATPAVISDANLADDAEITISTTQIGSGVAGAGLKITLIGTRT